MAKKIKLSKSLMHNVYLLYFLFIATLLHLGYFLFTKENTLLVSFSLAIVFVYLVNPNMVIVLGISLIFINLLCLVKKMPESRNYPYGSLLEGFDISGVDVSGVDVSGVDVSGVDVSQENDIEEYTDSEGRPLTMSNLFNKVKEEFSQDKDLRDAVNTLVGTKGVLKENITGNSIKEVDKQANKVKSLINNVKNMSPEVQESLKSLNSININELNKLINNLNNMTKDISKDVA